MTLKTLINSSTEDLEVIKRQESEFRSLITSKDKVSTEEKLALDFIKQLLGLVETQKGVIEVQGDIINQAFVGLRLHDRSFSEDLYKRLSALCA